MSMFENLNLIMDDVENDPGYHEFRKNIASWKKEFSYEEVSDAFVEAASESPLSSNQLFNIALADLCSDMLEILFPTEEYKDRFIKKGGE